MNKQNLKIYFITDNKSGYKTREKHVINKFPDLYKEIILYNEKFGDISFNQKLYNYLHDIEKIPNCLTCNKKIEWRGIYTEGYKEYCNLQCAGKGKKRLENIKKTTLKRHGVEHISQSEEIKDKIKENNIKKYGVEHIFQSEEIKDKIKENNIKKYGVEYTSQSEEIKDKIKENNIKKYGVDNPSKLNSVKNKLKQTNLKRYGVPSVMQNQKIVNKYIDSVTKENIIKYKERLGEHVVIINNGDNLIIKNQCDIHDSYIINRTLFYYRVLKHNIQNPCIKCNPVNYNISIKENEIIKFINEELKIKSKKIKINNKKIDIYIPSKKFGIEFNGLYWHSELFKSKNYHLEKTEIANSKNIILFHIFEDEWIHKKEIIKSVIQYKLGLINNKIYARKCIIKEVTNKASKEFLDKNHIQGGINSPIRLGLFYNNELVSIMTFGKLRRNVGIKSKKGEYELYRFCNKINTIVIGSASKLLNYFIKNYDVNYILTFADRRYSSGDLYGKLGFNFIWSTLPNYWYFSQKDKIRYHRFKFRKKMLIKKGYDKNKTEHEIMLERGYLRIYDCGNIKYELKINK